VIWIDHDRYYAPKSDVWWEQGDVVLAPVAVFDGEPEEASGIHHSADSPFVRRMFWPAHEFGGRTTGEASLGPAMILSHGCSIDKEWNRAVDKLCREGHSRKRAKAIADDDDDLDRRLVVAPIIRFGEAASAEQELRANKVIGFFPVCDSPTRGIDGGIVDLSRVTTIDRGVIVDRLGILSDDARATLLYALARYWAYRAPQMTYELEEAIGKRILHVEIAAGGELGVELTLSDHSVIRLLQAPAEPGGAPERQGLRRNS
jgi:hypothetical protein